MSETNELLSRDARIGLVEAARRVLTEADREQDAPPSVWAEVPTLYEVTALVRNLFLTIGNSVKYNAAASETEAQQGCLTMAAKISEGLRELESRWTRAADRNYPRNHPVRPLETRQDQSNVITMRRAA